MDQKLFSYDPETGVGITFVDGEGDTFHLHNWQDPEVVQGILDMNHQKRSMGRAYYAKDADMWKAASIPMNVQMIWLTKYGVDAFNDDHQPAVRKLLNDPEWKYLKTAEIII